MKRYNIFKIATAIIMFLMVSSCSDWLHQPPRGEEEAGRLFSSLDGFKEALAGSYTLMSQPELYGKELTFGTIGFMGQEWGSGGNLGNNQSQQYLLINYRYTELAVRPVVDNFWKKMYNAIINANVLISYCEEKKGVLEDMHDVIAGEALAIRAYLHFDLFRLYAEQGAEHLESKQLAYISLPKPVITQFITNKLFVEYLLEDINDALVLLEQDPIYTNKTPDGEAEYFINRNFHLNYYAVCGLKARVLQYIGEKEEAKKWAEIVVAAQKTQKIFNWVSENAANPGSNVATTRDRTFSSEQLFALNTVKMVDNIKTFFTETGSSAPYTTRLAPNTMFLNGDYRMKNFETNAGYSEVFSKLWQMAPRVGVNPIRDRMPMIRVSEMYYILADYYAESDPAKAVELLNEVLAARNVADVLELPAADQTTFVNKEILKEYQREFLGEGQLFFFHKRIGTATIATTKAKYVVPLPDKEIEFRPELVIEGDK